MRERHLLKSIKSLYLNFILTGVLGYTIRIIYARNLSLEEYGLFYAVLSFVSFISAFRDLGLSESLAFFIPRWKFRKKWQEIKSATIFTIIVEVIISVSVCLLIFIFRDYIVKYIFDNNSKAIWLLMPISLWFIIRGIIEPIKWLLKGLQKFIIYAWSDTIALGFIVIFSLISFLYFPKYFAFGWPLGSFIVIFYYLYTLFKINFHNSKFRLPSKALIKEMLSYSLPLLFVISSGIILTNFNTLSLSVIIGLESVALYNIALPIANILSDSFNPFIDLITPLISDSKARNDLRFIKDILKTFYTDLLSLIIPLLSLVIIFSNDIIITIFGEKFIDAAPLLQILVIVAIVKFYSRLNLTYVSFIEKATKLKAKLSIITLFIHIFVVIFSTLFYGLIGLIIGLLISAIITFYFSSYYLKQRIAITLPKLKLAQIFILNILIFILYYHLASYIAKYSIYNKIILIILAYLVAITINIFVKNINIKKLYTILKNAKKED